LARGNGRRQPRGGSAQKNGVGHSRHRHRIRGRF
jgi:hypothetical protein